jgi:hypothetical protein
MNMEPHSGTGVACALAALRAFEEQRWQDFASLMKASDLERFREHYLSSVGNLVHCRTAAQHQEDRPDMPEPVARYYAERDERHARAYDAMLLELGFDGLELALQSPAHVLAFYFRARRLQETAIWRRQEDAWMRAFGERGRRSYIVIGSLAAGAACVYVVYRPQWSAAGSDSIVGPATLLKVTKGSEGWRLHLNIEQWWRSPQVLQYGEETTAKVQVAAPPEARAASILRAVEENRWADAVSQFEPGSLQAAKDERLKLLRLAGHNVPQTLDEFIQEHSDLPAFVAEYEFEYERRQLQSWKDLVADELASSFDEEYRAQLEEGIRYLEDGMSNRREIERIEQQTPAEVMEAVFKSMDLRSLASSHRPPDEPWMPEQNAPMRVVTTVVGTVPENDAIAHVIYRMLWKTPGENHEPAATRVMTLRTTPEGWLMEYDREAFLQESDSFAIFGVSDKDDDG